MFMCKLGSALTILVALASAGCGLGRVGPVFAKEAPNVPAASVGSGLTSCPLTIQLENKDGDDTRMISEVACVKMDGNQIALPSDLSLWINNKGIVASNYNVCKAGTINLTSDPEVLTCVWNGTFRHNYPWTITLKTNVAPSEPIATYLKAVRVFRNGELVWKWAPKSNDLASDITVRGEDLKQSLLPEGAPLDLRLVPQGIEVDEAALATKVQEHPRQWERQLRAATDAILTSPSLANGKLKEKLSCISYRAQMARYNAEQIVDATKGVAPAVPSACSAIPLGGAPSSLKSRYDALKVKSHESIDGLEQTFISDIKSYSAEVKVDDKVVLNQFKTEASDFWNGKGGNGSWWYELNGAKDDEEHRKALLVLIEQFPDIRRALLQGHLIKDVWGPSPTVKVSGKLPSTPSHDEVEWLEMRAVAGQVEFVVSSADSMLQQGLAVIDDTISLQASIRKDVLRISGSTDEQARLFLRVANNLQETSMFDQIKQNPELLVGERALGMRYSDHLQLFFIAPWTGFPVSTKGKADFSGANLIPILDAIGGRWQPSGSRFADFRIGVGVTALSFNAKVAQFTLSDTNAIALTTAEQPQLRFAPEGNLSIANFKFGCAVAIGGNLPTIERVRFLVGADLYKILSGANLEAGTY